MDWLNEIQSDLEASDQFGSVEISADRSSVTLVWFGDPQPLAEYINAAPSSLAVEVKPAAFLPGELRRIAAELLNST